MVVSGVNKVVNDASGALQILCDINFSVEAGQTVALVGASGSGKSTLLSILAGLDTPSSGEVHILGESLFDRSEDDRAAFRAKHMAFVFQSFQLLSSLTALENVMLPLELAGASEPRRKAIELLKQVGLGDRLNHYPKVLSGGEQQRVALARAFVVEPAILLADEPTGSLDHATGKAIMDLMLSMNRARGTTLILVTHDEGISQLCQRRLRMHQGHLTEL
jgi:putative ABC transport system ATP-binding protein